MALSAFVFSLMGLCVNVLAWNSSLTPWELVAFRGVTLWVLSAELRSRVGVSMRVQRVLVVS